MEDYQARNLQIADDLAEKSWSQKKNYFSDNLTKALLADMRAQDEAGKMTLAGIGREEDHQIRERIRNDRTLWLAGHAPAPRQFLDIMEKLRQDLNRLLFLGLFEYEAHYALYPPGGFYKKHRDSFRGGRNRVVSTVTYLTPDWREEDGGHLVLYSGDNEKLETGRMLPESGTLAVFMSEEIPHEVRPPARERASIAGWFRCNASTGERVDPLR